MSQYAASDDREQADHINEFRRQIEMGLDVEQFLETPAGRKLIKRANQELQDAQLALVEQDLQSEEGRARAMELQFQARVAARVISYFGDLTTEAEAAQKALQVTYDESGGPL